MRMALLTNLSFLRTQVHWIYRVTGNNKLFLSLRDLEEGLCLTQEEREFLEKLNNPPLPRS